MNEFEKEIFQYTSWQLTNERINKILMEVNLNKYKAWQNLHLEDIKKYFASVLTLYGEVFVALKEEEIKSINTFFENYWRKYQEIISGKNVTFRDLVYMLIQIDSAQNLMRIYLQNYEYFFKKTKREVKGIEEALKVIANGGGIFGVA